jgi:hypothetical protein
MLKGELRNHTIETNKVKFQGMTYDHMEVVNRADKNLRQHLLWQSRPGT